MLFWHLITLLLTFPHSESLNGKSRQNDNNYTDYSEPYVDPYWKAQKKYIVNLDDFCGELPAELQMAVTMMNHKDQFAKVGLEKTSNFIFYGPPGTGKTYIASIFAQKIGAEFMYVQGNELLDKWQGAGLEKPVELFNKARERRDLMNKPVVMFIDEVDTVLGSRNDFNLGVGQMQLIGSMLKEIGAEVNNNIIVVVATNRIEALDVALLRSGRFEFHIPFNLPNIQQRYTFLLFLIKSYSHIFSENIDWKLVAQKTEGFSPADLKKFIDMLKTEYVLKKIEYQEYDQSFYKISYDDICCMLPSTQTTEPNQLKIQKTTQKQTSFLVAWYQYFKSFVV